LSACLFVRSVINLSVRFRSKNIQINDRFSFEITAFKKTIPNNSDEFLSLFKHECYRKLIVFFSQLALFFVVKQKNIFWSGCYCFGAKL